MRSNTTGYGNPARKPPMNTRLQKQPPHNYRGMSRGDDDSEYQPTERKTGMRSSRIGDSRERNKPTIASQREVGNNVPRGSHQAKKPFGGIRQPPKARAKPKPSYGARAADPAPMGTMSHDEDSGVRGVSKKAADIYQNDFGDEAYERPQALKPCPS